MDEIQLDAAGVLDDLTANAEFSAAGEHPTIWVVGNFAGAITDSQDFTTLGTSSQNLAVRIRSKVALGFEQQRNNAGLSVPFFIQNGTPASDLNKHLFRANWDGTTAALKVDSTEVVSDTLSGSMEATDLFEIKAGTGIGGDDRDLAVSEVFIFKNELSAEQEAGMLAYVNSIYGQGWT